MKIVLHLAAFGFPLLGLYVAARELVGGIAVLSLSLVFAFVAAFYKPKSGGTHEDDK